MESDKNIKAYKQKPEGYKIPEGYFSTAKEEIIKHKESQTPKIIPLKPILSVAASITLLIALYFIYPKEVIISNQDVLAYLESDIESLEEEDLMDFISVEEEWVWDELLDLDEETIFNEL